ncbi:uroporphyrinogen-III synthase [Dimargaris cristalligena]|nr:uroporphyrinogen-III synthase [Dimargaris cristalligena]
MTRPESTPPTKQQPNVANPPHVLLLRNPDENNDPNPNPPTDRYIRAFQAHGWTTTSLPVLCHHWLNADLLCSTLLSPTDPPSEGTPLPPQYWGLVLTSGRAIDALEAAIAPLSSADRSLIWQFGATRPVFVVGPNTYRRAKSFFERAHTGSAHSPDRSQIIGREAGDAVHLLEYIQAYVNEHRPVDPTSQTGAWTQLAQTPASAAPTTTTTTTTTTPVRSSGPASLLFLSSRQRRPTLVSGLIQRGINVTELPVYDTGADPTVPQRLTREGAADRTEQPPSPEILPIEINQSPVTTAQTADQSSRHRPWDWVVFFSPSGVDATWPAIVNTCAKETSRRRARGLCSPPLPRLATIGITTANHLQSQYHVEPEVVASQPNPECLVAEIIQYEANHA